jgi:hypothetical protein
MVIFGQGPSNTRLPMINNDAADRVVRDAVRFTGYHVREVFIHTNCASAYVSFVEQDATNFFLRFHNGLIENIYRGRPHNEICINVKFLVRNDLPRPFQPAQPLWADIAGGRRSNNPNADLLRQETARRVEAARVAEGDSETADVAGAVIGDTKSAETAGATSQTPKIHVAGPYPRFLGISTSNSVARHSQLSGVRAKLIPPFGTQLRKLRLEAASNVVTHKSAS